MKLMTLLLCVLLMLATQNMPQDSNDSEPDALDISSSSLESYPQDTFDESQVQSVSPVDPSIEKTQVACPFKKEGDWYLISSASDLAQLQQLLDQHAVYPDGSLAKEGKYRLTQPIDLSPELDAQIGWIPIGSFLSGFERTSQQWAAFSGEFDGGGHAITGLVIKNENLYTPHGLFGYTTDAVIRNVVILDCNVSSTHVAGAVVGQNTTSGRRETMVVDCFASGRVSGSSQIGGILGMGEQISGCGFEGEVTGVYDRWLERGAYGIGGVAGTVDKVVSCYARANTSGYEYVGGVAGSSLRTKNSYCIGEVRGVQTVGGVVGSGAVVEGCYSVVDIFGYEAVGGIAGYVATTYNVEPETIDGLVSHVLSAGGSVNEIAKPDEMENEFDWPIGRVLGFVGAGIGTQEMYALQTMQVNFITKLFQNSYYWDGDNFPEQYLNDPTAWPEILTLEGEQWEDNWKWKEGDYPALRWETSHG